jgi:hypothetical protein
VDSAGPNLESHYGPYNDHSSSPAAAAAALRTTLSRINVNFSPSCLQCANSLPSGRQGLHPKRHPAPSKQAGLGPFSSYPCHKSALLNSQHHPRSVFLSYPSVETHVGRARCAQGFTHAGILQRVVRFRVFTAAQDSWRQIDGDESFFMRNELRRFETCAIFLQQVLKMLFFWLKRQVGYWVIFQADWFMWMFSKSSQCLHNQWEGRGLCHDQLRI